MRYHEAEGLTTVEACEVLRHLASLVPEDQAIVEIGVYRGRSLLALAEGAQLGNGATVTGIDPFNTPRPSKPKYASDETYVTAQLNVRDSIASDYLRLVKGFSITTAGRWDTTQKVGMLYIDADHREVPVLQDFHAWSWHMVPGSIVAFDDCDEATFPGVVRAVEKLKRLGRIDNVTMHTDRLCVARFAK